MKIAALACVLFVPLSATAVEFEFAVEIDRGEDHGQSFGSLFEAKSDDGSLVIGAGFPNAYNTRYRADRHEVQFFIRPVDESRELVVEEITRPNDTLTGAYLYSRDGVVYSTYGGVKTWNADTHQWDPAPTSSGGTRETMRLGKSLLKFGGSSVIFDQKIILDPPQVGNYQLFFYANGHLCFYHVHRGDGPYRPWKNDKDGFSRLYACPWRPGEGAVDLSKAIVFRTPVVGETTFAWGQLGNQIVTGSNVGGFYVFDNTSWRMILAPIVGKSFQLYSSVAFHDRLLMGHYPTGHVFQYDGRQLVELANSPPVLPGVSNRAREAQTTAVYGGQLFVGVWPWGELWRYRSESDQWQFQRRMFDHPALSDDLVHPYDVENQNHRPRNLWGQRVTSLVPNGTSLFVGTSAKSPLPWDAKSFPFLAPEKWKSYGTVYRLTMPGHLGTPIKWTEAVTSLSFAVDGDEMIISQDGKRLASARIPAKFADQLQSLTQIDKVNWGRGIYGPFGGVAIEGKYNLAQLR